MPGKLNITGENKEQFCEIEYEDIQAGRKRATLSPGCFAF